MAAPESAAALAAFRAGAASPHMTLMRLLLVAPDLDHIAGLVRFEPALAALVALQRPEIERAIAALAAVGRHDLRSSDPVTRWRAAFDRAVAISPEASVALYSLGAADLLAAATKELLALLARWGVTGPGRSIVEIGCGIGRCVAPLAVEAARVIGVELSYGMARVAAARVTDRSNALIVQGGGRDLSFLADRSCELVLAVDVFPYLVEAGLAEAHVAAAARILRPNGAFALFNWSYRGDLNGDRAEAVALASAHGFTTVHAGVRDLASWDGAGFLFRRS